MSGKSEHLLRKLDVISIFQDGGRGRSILLPVSHLLMPLYLEGQSLSANQTSWS